METEEIDRCRETDGAKGIEMGTHKGGGVGGTDICVWGLTPGNVIIALRKQFTFHTSLTTPDALTDVNICFCLSRSLSL